MPRRYYRTKRTAPKPRWLRTAVSNYSNFPSIATNTFTSKVFVIAENYRRIDNLGAASASNVANITVKNVRCEFNLPDCNTGESYLCSIVFVPNGVDPTNNGTVATSLGSTCYQFTNPDYTMAEKSVTVNDNDDSKVVLSTRLARKLGPNDKICLLITHINYGTAASDAGYVTFHSSYFVKSN